jgi:hypothetical protein
LATPLPPQVWPAGHAVGQLSECPQPSPTVPQYWPPVGVQVVATQVAEPHRLATPLPPQVWPAGHDVVPQSTVPPQPSPIMPQ